MRGIKFLKRVAPDRSSIDQILLFADQDGILKTIDEEGIVSAVGNGEKGDTGDQGPPGDPGEKGDTGDQGPPGDPGSGSGLNISKVVFNGTLDKFDPPDGIDNVDILIVDTAPPLWSPETEYSIYQVGNSNISQSIVKRNASPDVWFQAYLSRGISGSEEPEWSDEINSYITDNGISWQATNNHNTQEWSPSTEFAVGIGDYIFGGFVWRPNTTGNTGLIEPDWSSVEYGGGIEDGEIIWGNQGSANVWEPDTKYGVGVLSDGTQYTPTFVIPTTPNGIIYQFFASTLPVATNGQTEPNWNDVEVDSGKYFYDGDVLWSEININSIPTVMFIGMKAPESSNKILTFIILDDHIYDHQRYVDIYKNTDLSDELISIFNLEDHGLLSQQQSLYPGYFLKMIYNDGGWQIYHAG